MEERRYIHDTWMMDGIAQETEFKLKPAKKHNTNYCARCYCQLRGLEERVNVNA
jgi:hypothetical protein